MQKVSSKNMNNLTFNIDKVEDRFKIKIRRNATCLGLDTASKTGVCEARTDEENIYLSIGFINIDVSKIADKAQKNELRYNMFYEKLNEIIKEQDIVVIEDVFFGRNVQSLILLSRIGAISYCIAKVKKIKRIQWHTAVQARKKLGLPCNKKKEVVHAEFCKRLRLKKVTNEDEVDSILLSIVGLLEE